MSVSTVATTRCAATAKQTGQQCKRTAEPGATVCRYHGAAAPQVHLAAAGRVLEAKLNGTLQQRGWQPVTDPIAHYADLGGEVLAFKDLCRERINQLEGRWESAAEGFIAEDTKAAVQLYERALDRADKILASMLRIGLDAEALRQGRERPSREQAETLSQVIAQVLSDPRVSVAEGQANAVILDALRGLAA